jgi:hypothetical protein
MINYFHPFAKASRCIGRRCLGQGCERSKGRFSSCNRLTGNGTFDIISSDNNSRDTHTYLQAARGHSSYLACPNQAGSALGSVM